MFVVFRKIGEAKHGLLMGKYETKQEARLAQQAYEIFDHYDCIVEEIK